MCDEIGQCESFGECSHALALSNNEEGGVASKQRRRGRKKKLVLTSLGSLVCSGRPARAKTDITVFDSTGVAVQDVVIAGLALKLMMESPNSRI